MSGKTIVSTNFKSALLPIINEWNSEAKNRLDAVTPKLYKVSKTDKAVIVNGTSMGLPLFNEMTESGALKYGADQELYKPRFEQKLWGAGFKISLMSRIFNDYIREGQMHSEQLAANEVATQDILACRLFNLAAASGSAQLGGDGQPLASASHTSPIGSQSNLLALDLNEGALVAARRLVRKMTNNRGVPLNLQTVKIVAGVDLEDELLRLTNSTGRTGTPDNDINTIKTYGMFPGGVITHPNITSSVTWTIITNAPMGLECYVGYESAVEKDNEFDTKNMCFSKVFCRAYGYTNWRTAVHSAGD